VAPHGSDAGQGAADRPFRTIQRAAETMQPGDTCLVRAGVYRETIRPARSGEPDKPITFAAERGQAVVVSGADPVEGWRLEKGRIYRARADWAIEQLFADGRMMNLARWPNSSLDPMRPTWAVAGKGSGPSTIVDPNLPALDLKGATLHVLPGEHWVAWTRPIAEYDQSAHALKFDGTWSQDAALTVREGSKYCLMGLPALLDSPGEWCLDAEGKAVSLWTPRGDSPAKHRVEAKRRDLAFDLSGRRHVRVEGFRIFAATISLSDAAHCLVRDCHLRYASHFTDCEGWNPRSQFLNGVVIGGHDNLMRGCSVVYSAGNGIMIFGERNTVRNCLVRDVDYMAVDCAAVRAEGRGHVIAHNTIADAGRSVVWHLGLKAGLIVYNDLGPAGRLTRDQGITYCWDTDGEGTVIAYNLAHDNSSGAAIYLDNGCSNFLIHHNVCWNNSGGAIALNTPSHNNLVCNNTIVLNRASVDYWTANDNKDQAGSRLVNNILTDTVRTGDGIEVSHNFTGKDPGFVDAERLDFRLRPGSPCLDAGVPIAGIATRFVGKAPDLGAYEFGAAAWKAGHDWGEPPIF
jgi:hypothetical protein